jgi:hypothetical protein
MLARSEHGTAMKLPSPHDVLHAWHTAFWVALHALT